jgi:type IV pilus assembly protein PilE
MADDRGFSMIELMIAVVVIGILAAIAIPGYRAHVLKTQRSDGTTALMEAAHRMERFFTMRTYYCLDPADEAVCATVGSSAADTIPAVSGEGFYTLSFPAGNLPTAAAYTIQAVKRSANDGECTVLTIDNLGRKGPPGCW